MNGPRVVVIGGGVTGLGVLWDLALRGVTATLVEQGRLAHGTTGRFHGLLHSGARYAVDDPESARQCAAENLRLRRIAPLAIEPCGGVFVRLAGEEPAYGVRWRRACAEAGIRVRTLDPARLRADEPALTRAVVEAYEVPDAGIDSFRLVEGLARGATGLGARLLLRHRVVAARVDGGAVRGVVLDGPAGRLELPADLVINAAGPWVDRVARLFGARVPVRLSAGAHLILGERASRRVLNRLRPPGDADILVPHDLTSILGTTSVKAGDLDAPSVSAEEVDVLLRGGEALLPGFSGRRVLRAFAGVRSLLCPEHGGTARSASRAFAVIDHGGQVGPTGLLSVVGGKLTTFRLMAEAAVTAGLARVGLAVACATAERPVPGLDRPPPADRAAERLGPLRVERDRRTAADPLLDCVVCECERVTGAELAARLAAEPAACLDRLREATWFGMGPCQGTFCLPRILVRAGGDAAAARGFLAERWRGQAPVFFGAQAREVAWMRALYAAALWDAAGPREQACDAG